MVPGGTINYLLDIDTVKSSSIYGGVQNDQAGQRLASGDLNGDGIDDILIGAPLSGWGQSGTTGKGRVYLVLGGDLGASIDLYHQADSTFALSEDVARIGFKTGNALATGDINADGIDDLMISSTGAFAISGANGWVHVLYGRTGWESSYAIDTQSDIAVIAPEDSGSDVDPLTAGRMGSSLGLGDFDNDGYLDMALGAPWGLGNESMTGNGWAGVIFDPLRIGRDNFDWQVTEIYIATLGYAPDNEGLQYWIAELSAEGTSWTPGSVAQSFFDQPLVEAMYPTGQDYNDFITALYQNIFGRDPDEDGRAYWYEELQSGRVQRDAMIIALLNGGWDNPDAATDMARFGNQVQVGITFAAGQAERGIVYNDLAEGDQQALRTAGAQVVSGVTDDPSTRDAALSSIPTLLLPFE